MLDLNLEEVRADLRAKARLVPQAIPALIAALRQGNINGTAYYARDPLPRCFVGTIARALDVSPSALPFEMSPWSPVESWFLGITPGMTPEKSPVVAMTIGWLEEVLAEASHRDRELASV